MRLFGFSLLRNGVKYDYSFHESLTSLSGITEKIYLALGEGEDNTAEVLEKYDFLHIIPTVWDHNMRKSGLILSQQTNIALDGLRKDFEQEDGVWGFYLQADEVINEEDYEKMKRDIAYANEHGYDAVRFRYLHFWSSHNKIAVDFQWYPQEIRAVRLKSNVKSCLDAQGFEGFEKVYESDAFIYHYGHARSDEGYEEKYKEFHKWWHASEKAIARSKRKFEKRTSARTLKLLPYFGTHPSLMQKRIEEANDVFEQATAKEVYILADKSIFSEEFIAQINAEQVHWVTEENYKKAPKDQLVILEPGFWQKLRYKSEVPTKTYSDLARTWTPETILTLKLAEKGVGLKKIK